MPPREMKWVEIRDFRPGIQQKVGGGASGERQGFPLGSCTDETYGCIAAPNGALIPLPAETAFYDPAPPDNFVNVLNGRYYISGFHVAGPLTGAAVGSGTQSEFHIAYDYFMTTAPNPHREYRWERHQIFANPVGVDLIVTHTGLANPTLDAIRGTFFEDVRMDPADPLNPGIPLVAGAWYEEGGGADMFVTVYPDPNAPATNASLNISTTLACDIIAAHQGRLVMFEQRGWNHGSPGSWISNEQIWFTNINLPTIEPTVAQTFATDRMTGIGAVKGVSANEILMVKFQGGAFTVAGDFSNPTVIRLPGVAPTYGATVIPVYTSLGLIYAALAGGVYAWGGGSDSQLLSGVLEDGFWMVADLGPWINYHGKFELWRDYIACPNSWLYDTKTNGWWRLRDKTLADQFFHYGVDYTGTLFAVPSQITAGSVLVRSFAGAGGTAYKWVGNAIPNVETPGRGVTIREVVLEATGDGEVTITLSALPGGDQPDTFVVAGSEVVIHRKAAAIHSPGYIGVTIEGVGSGGAAPAPTVFSVKVGYYEDTPVNPT